MRTTHTGFPCRYIAMRMSKLHEHMICDFGEEREMGDYLYPTYTYNKVMWLLELVEVVKHK